MFCPPDPEEDDLTVVCPGCETEKPASEMKMTLDAEDMVESGAVIKVTRRYVCSEECALSLIGIDA